MELYSIGNKTHVDGNYAFSIRLDPDHPVYDGHFPGQPVTPGVLQIRIVRELLQDAMNIKLDLKAAQSIKFIRFIDPGQVGDLDVNIDLLEHGNGTVRIRSDISDAQGPYFKMMAEFSGSSNQ